MGQQLPNQFIIEYGRIGDDVCTLEDFQTFSCGLGVGHDGKIGWAEKDSGYYLFEHPDETHEGGPAYDLLKYVVALYRREDADDYSSRTGRYPSGLPRYRVVENRLVEQPGRGKQ